MTTTTTEALKPVTQLSEYIPVKHAAPKADCIDLYLVAYHQLHTPNVNNLQTYCEMSAVLHRMSLERSPAAMAAET